MQNIFRMVQNILWNSRLILLKFRYKIRTWHLIFVFLKLLMSSKGRGNQNVCLVYLVCLMKHFYEDYKKDLLII